LGALDNGVELRSFGFGDGGCEGELGSEFGQGRGIGSKKFEAQKLAARGRIDGWVDGVGAPFDEERKKTTRVLLQVGWLLARSFAVAAVAGTAQWPIA